MENGTGCIPHVEASQPRSTTIGPELSFDACGCESAALLVCYARWTLRGGALPTTFCEAQQGPRAPNPNEARLNNLPGLGRRPS
jgi:hypothetical protein